MKINCNFFLFSDEDFDNPAEISDHNSDMIISDEDIDNPDEISDHNDDMSDSEDTQTLTDTKITDIDESIFSTLLYQENEPDYSKTENIKAGTKNADSIFGHLSKMIEEYDDNDPYKKLENLYNNREIIQKRVAPIKKFSKIPVKKQIKDWKNMQKQL